MELTIKSTPEDVQAALDKVESDYRFAGAAAKEIAKRERKELLAWKRNRTRVLKRLLAVVETNPPGGNDDT